MLPLSAPSNLPKEVSVFVRVLCGLALNVPLRVPTRVEDLGGVLFVFFGAVLLLWFRVRGLQVLSFGFWGFRA